MSTTYKAVAKSAQTADRRLTTLKMVAEQKAMNASRMAQKPDSATKKPKRT